MGVGESESPNAATQGASAVETGDAPFALLSANGPAEESQLAVVDRHRLADEALGRGNFRWIAPGEAVSIEGAGVAGQDLWWWLVVTVASCLVVEMTVLAWPTIRQTRPFGSGS
jgi:hypothetical protein